MGLFNSIFKGVQNIFGGNDEEKKKRQNKNTYYKEYKAPAPPKTENNPYVKKPGAFYGDKSAERYDYAFGSRLYDEYSKSEEEKALQKANGEKVAYSNVYDQTVEAKDEVEMEYLKEHIWKKFQENPDKVTPSEADFYNGKTNRIEGLTYNQLQYQDEAEKNEILDGIWAKYQDDPSTVTRQEMLYYNNAADTPYKSDYKPFTKAESDAYNREFGGQKFLLDQVRQNADKIEKFGTGNLGLVHYDGKTDAESFDKLEEFSDAFVVKHDVSKDNGQKFLKLIKDAENQGKKTIVFKNGDRWSQATLADAKANSTNLFRYSQNQLSNLDDIAVDTGKRVIMGLLEGFDGGRNAVANTTKELTAGDRKENSAWDLALNKAKGPVSNFAGLVRNTVKPREGTLLDNSLWFADTVDPVNFVANSLKQLNNTDQRDPSKSAIPSALKRGASALPKSLLQYQSAGLGDDHIVYGDEILTDNFDWEKNAGRTKIAGFGLDVAGGFAAAPSSIGQTVALRSGKLASNVSAKTLNRVDEQLIKRADDLALNETERMVFDQARKNLLDKKNADLKGIAKELTQDINQMAKGNQAELGNELKTAMSKMSQIFNAPVKSDLQGRFLGRDVVDIGNLMDKVLPGNRLNVGLAQSDRSVPAAYSNLLKPFTGNRSSVKLPSTMAKNDPLNTSVLSNMFREQDPLTGLASNLSDKPVLKSLVEPNRFSDKYASQFIDNLMTQKGYTPNMLSGLFEKGRRSNTPFSELIKSLPSGQTQLSRTNLQFSDPSSLRGLGENPVIGKDTLDYVKEGIRPYIDGTLSRTANKSNPNLLENNLQEFLTETQLPAQTFAQGTGKEITDKVLGQSKLADQLLPDAKYLSQQRNRTISEFIDKMGDTPANREIIKRAEKLLSNNKQNRLLIDDLVPKNASYEQLSSARQLVNELNKSYGEDVLGNNPFMRKMSQAIDKKAEPIMRKFDKTYGVDGRMVNISRDAINENQYAKNTVKEDLTQLFKGVSSSDKNLLRRAYVNGESTGKPELDAIMPEMKRITDESFELSGMNPEQYIENYLPIIRTDTNKSLFKTREAESDPLSLYNRYAQSRNYDNVETALNSGLKVESDPAKLVMKRFIDGSNLGAKQKIIDQATKEGIEITGDNKRYLDELFTHTANEDLPMTLRTLKKFNDTWKNVIINTLPFSSPAARNFMGGAGNNFLEGVNLADYGRAMKVKAGKQITLSDGTKIDADDFRQSALLQGVDQGQHQADFVDPSREWDIATGKQNPFSWLNPNNNPLVKGGQKLNSGIEETLRTARFIRGLDDYGNTPVGKSMAGLDVERTHFNYNSQKSLTPFEQKLKDYVLPFYTFQRFNTPFQIEKTLTNPQRVNMINSAERNLDEEEGDVGDRPHTMNNTVLIGDRYYSTAFNPRNSLTDMGGTALAGMISPFLKAPIDASGLTEKQLGTGSSLDGKTYVNLMPEELREGFANSLFGKMSKAEMTEDGRLLVGNRLASPINNIFPNFKRTDDLVADISGDTDINGDQFFAKTFGGISNYDKDVFDSIEQSEKMTRQNVVNDRLEKLIKQGILSEEDRFDGDRDFKDRNKAKEGMSQIKLDAAYAETLRYMDKVNFKLDNNKYGYFSRWGTKFDEFGNIVDYDPSKDKMKEVPVEEMMERVRLGQEKAAYDQWRFAQLFEKKKKGKLSQKDMYNEYGQAYNFNPFSN